MHVYCLLITIGRKMKVSISISLYRSLIVPQFLDFPVKRKIKFILIKLPKKLFCSPFLKRQKCLRLLSFDPKSVIESEVRIPCQWIKQKVKNTFRNSQSNIYSSLRSQPQLGRSIRQLFREEHNVKILLCWVLTPYKMLGLHQLIPFVVPKDLKNPQVRHLIQLYLFDRYYSDTVPVKSSIGIYKKIIKQNN